MSTPTGSRLADPSKQLVREKADPREAKNPLPALFLVLLGGLAAFGLYYFVENAGTNLAFSGDQRSPQQVGPKAELSGEALFKNTCAPCHQESGAGVPPAFPPLVGSPWVLDDRETAVRVVLLGLEGAIEVKGATYNGAMPRLGDRLSDGEIAKILGHVRSSWGNAAPAIDEKEVAAVRASLKGRTATWKGGAELASARQSDAGAP
jgi:mono/diheme cytochrome c family protein